MILRGIKWLQLMLPLMVVMLLVPEGYGAARYTADVAKNRQLEQWIQEALEDGDIPGAAVSIVKDGEVVLANGFGQANRQSKQAADTRTLFDLGTAEELIAADALRMLQAAGKLALNHPVSQYIPGFYAEVKDLRADLTIGQVLNYHVLLPLPKGGLGQADASAAEELIGSRAIPHPFPSGITASGNLALIKEVIARAAGKPYSSYITENYMPAVGLTGSYTDRSKVVEQGLALALGYKEGVIGLTDIPKGAASIIGGEFYTNAADLAVWLQHQLSEQPVAPTGGTNNGGLILASDEQLVPEQGWYTGEDGTEWYRLGYAPGYTSFVLLKPSERVGVAVLINRSSWQAEELGRGLLTELGFSTSMPEAPFEPLYSTLGTLTNQSRTILFLLIGLIGATCYFIGRSILQIVRSKRTFVGIKLKPMLGLTGSLMYMAGLGFGLHFIYTHMKLSGFTLEDLTLLAAEPLRWTVMLAVASIAACYLYFLIIHLFREESNKEYYLLVLLSVLGGFGNASTIFTINHMVKNEHADLFEQWLYFTLGLLTFFVSQQLVRRNLITITFDTVYRKRIQLIRIISNASFQKLENIERGRINATLNNDTEVISRFSNLIVMFITNMITLVFCFTYLSMINIFGFLLSLFIVGVAGVIYYLVGKKTRATWERNRDIQSTFFGYIHDLLNGFKELYLHERKKREFVSDMIDTCDDYRKTRVTGEYRFITVNSLASVMFMLCLGIVVFAVPFMPESFDKSGLFNFIFIFLYMTGPINGVLTAIPSVIQFRISWNRINKTLRELESNLKGEESEMPAPVYEPEFLLELDQVVFSYGGKEDEDFSVGPFSYEFKSGQAIFIVGGNGSGKSTIAKLITGLYNPTAGEIRINGAKVESQQLTQCFSAVFSDFHLFKKLYGMDYQGKEELIERYLKHLRIDHKVVIQNNEFSTIRLSTGQRKRLALLVSYLEDRPVYLFDEWAADQDPFFREFFYKEIIPDLKARGKCIIAITHDDHYFDQADVIIKMDRGRIDRVDVLPSSEERETAVRDFFPAGPVPSTSY